MKKLFLTSKANNVLDKFIEMLDNKPSDLTVAFVPTAADPYEDKYFIINDRDRLAELGFNIVDINIADKSEEFLQEQFKNIDIIFVAGGNTFYLLEKTLASGFDKIIRKHIKNEKYYIGSSAGSILIGASLEPIQLLDDPSKWPNLKSFDGLKIIDKIILPHYGYEKYQEKMKKILQKYSNLSNDMIKLTDNQALIVEDWKFKIIW